MTVWTTTPNRLRIVHVGPHPAYGDQRWQLDAMDDRVPDDTPIEPWTAESHYFATWAEAMAGIPEFLASLHPDVAEHLTSAIRDRIAAHRILARVG